MAETVNLRIVERGAGLPVVFLHGFPFNHHIWDQQFDALSRDFRVLAPDLRGHGQSPAPEGVYTMDLLARDVVALLDDLGIARAVWVGHSMGGYLTMAALRIAPERIAGIGLVATHPRPDGEARHAERLEQAERVLREGSVVMAGLMIDLLFAPAVDPKSEVAQRAFAMMSETSPMGVAGSLRGMAERPDSMETLGNADIPAVVIAGADDQLATVDMMRRMADVMPQAEFVIIPNAGHMPMIEQPEALTTALDGFLKGL
jgi:pimeloyl-ACP methyl ester carboxylesterase